MTSVKSTSRRAFLLAAGAACVAEAPALGAEVSRVSSLGSVGVMSWSPDGKFLAVSHGPVLTLWNFATGERVRLPRVHKAKVLFLSFSQDSAYLVSGGNDGMACLWGLPEGREVQRILLEGAAVTSAAFCADGIVALGLWDGRLAFWRPAVSSIARLEQAHLFGYVQTAAAKDGTLLATGGDDQAVALWNPQTGERRLNLEVAGLGKKAMRARISAVAFLDNGRLLTCAASGMHGPITALWDIFSGRLLNTGVWPKSSLGVTSFSLSQDRSRGAFLPDLETQRVELVELPAWRSLWISDLKEYGTPRAVALAPAGRLVAIGMGLGSIDFWDTELNRPLLFLRDDWDDGTASTMGGASMPILQALRQLTEV